MDIYSTPDKILSRQVLKEINCNEQMNNKLSPSTKNGQQATGIDGDHTAVNGDFDKSTSSKLSSTVDSTKNSNYLNQINSTCDDLISNFTNLGLVTPIRHQNVHIENSNSPSSDDEIFQECENSFDTTPYDASNANIVAESGYRTANFNDDTLDATITFPSSQIANSTVTPDQGGLSRNNLSEQFAKTNSFTNQPTLGGESVRDNADNGSFETAISSTSNNKDQFFASDLIDSAAASLSTINLNERIDDNFEQTNGSEVTYESSSEEVNKVNTTLTNNDVNQAIDASVETAQIAIERYFDDSYDQKLLKQTTVDKSKTNTVNLEDESIKEQEPLKEAILELLPAQIENDDIVTNATDSANEPLVEALSEAHPKALPKALPEAFPNVLPVQVESDGIVTNAIENNDFLQYCQANEMAQKLANEITANDSIEPMDVDLNETVNIQPLSPCLPDILNTTESAKIAESHINTTLNENQLSSELPHSLEIENQQPIELILDQSDFSKDQLSHNDLALAQEIALSADDFNITIDVPNADDDSKINANPIQSKSSSETANDQTFNGAAFELLPTPLADDLNTVIAVSSDNFDKSKGNTVSLMESIHTLNTVTASEIMPMAFESVEAVVEQSRDCLNETQAFASATSKAENRPILTDGSATPLNETMVVSSSVFKEPKTNVANTIFDHQIPNLNITIDIQSPQIPLEHSTESIGRIAIITENCVTSPPTLNQANILNETITMQSSLPSVNTTFIEMPQKSATNNDDVGAETMFLPNDDENDDENNIGVNENRRISIRKDLYSQAPNTSSTSSSSSALSSISLNPPTKVQEAPTNKNDDIFKVPAIPTNTFADLKAIQSQFSVSDDEFQSGGLILNSCDFDFLLTKGDSSAQNYCRNSILERFDPLLGPSRKSVIQQLPVTKSVPPSIPEGDCSRSNTIPELDDFVTSLTRPQPENPLNEPNVAAGNVSGIIVKLDTTEIVNIGGSCGGGGGSQSSSSSETYETASFDNQLKTGNVTMSVGLIHDMNTDNMKSMEQEMNEQPNLKMNDEKKVKHEFVEDIERKLNECEAREESLLRRITEKDKALNKMSAVVENYEKTMVEMISEREQITQNYEKQLLQLKGERDANFHHLTSLENTFSDLHVKYEKSKQMALEVKENETKLLEKLDFCQQQMKLQEQRYDKLKNHAFVQLESANAKLEALNRIHSNEIKKLSAQLKKEEVSRQSINEQLAQKTKENEELVKICDELINNGPDGS